MKLFKTGYGETQSILSAPSQIPPSSFYILTQNK